MNKERLDSLVAIARQIMIDNPAAYLTGSLALFLQGMQVRRLPVDIDIYLPYGVDFKPHPGLHRNEELDDYEPEYYDRLTYENFIDRTNPVRVDILQPLDELYELHPGHLFNGTASIAGYPCPCGWRFVLHDEIMRFKSLHAMGRNHSRWKHRDDILFYYLQNCPL